VSGIAKGIWDNATKVWDAVTGIFSRSQSVAKEEMDAHSPSRVFQALGSFLPAGLVMGILGGAPDVYRAVQSLINVPTLETSVKIGAEVAAVPEIAPRVGAVPQISLQDVSPNFGALPQLETTANIKPISPIVNPLPTVEGISNIKTVVAPSDMAVNSISQLETVANIKPNLEPLGILETVANIKTELEPLKALETVANIKPNLGALPQLETVTNPIQNLEAVANIKTELEPLKALETVANIKPNLGALPQLETGLNIATKNPVEAFNPPVFNLGVQAAPVQALEGLALPVEKSFGRVERVTQERGKETTKERGVATVNQTFNLSIPPAKNGERYDEKKLIELLRQQLEPMMVEIFEREIYAEEV
jgi:hypothetical protein